MDLVTSANPWHSSLWKKHGENVVEEMDNRDPKGDKVPLMESVF